MIFTKNTCADIKQALIQKYKNNEISENGTIELINTSFIADESVIIGKLNGDYAKRELIWYDSCSLNVNDIPGITPKIWKQISTPGGIINSNYGWCIYSSANKSQYNKCLAALQSDKYSRQACMIYIRPTMHEDAVKFGMKDFMCTYSTQALIRNNKLYYIVFMRSNDAVFGYKNDKYWHDIVHDRLLKDVQQSYPEVTKGDLIWNAASFYVNDRHFKFLKASVQ